jgi:hypothetical protein
MTPDLGYAGTPWEPALSLAARNGCAIVIADEY